MVSPTVRSPTLWSIHSEKSEFMMSQVASRFCNKFFENHFVTKEVYVFDISVKFFCAHNYLHFEDLRLC